MAFWKAAGGELFEWQELVIEGMLGLDADDRWVSSDDGLDVARQNGKGVILQAVEAFFAFELGYRVVMHTAHEFATSQEHQFRLEDMIQNAPHLHAQVKDRGGYMHANGRESINLRSGCRIIFKARTKGGGRGYSGDLLVWDEAMVIPETVVGAQKPMLRASQAPHGPKTIYAGSAVDREVHEYGVPFARLRKRGIAREPRVSWHEWSAPFEHPSEMTEEVLKDRVWWRLANPSMEEGLVSEEHMADEIAAMDPRTAAVELGGVGDWPPTDKAGESIIDVDLWKSLLDPGSDPERPVVFAFDVSPRRTSASVVVAGKRPDGLVHVEVAEHRAGTGWVVPYLADRVRRHLPAAVVCVKSSPAGVLVAELERERVPVKALSSSEYADACGLFFDKVSQGEVRHRGDPELLAAVKGGRTRPVQDAWVWARTRSAIDITPLVAASIGVQAALGEQPSVYAARGVVTV